MTGPAPLLAAWYAALASRCEAAVRAAVTADIAIPCRGRPGLLPWTGEWRGAAECRRFFGIVARHLESLEVTPRQQVSQHGRVAVLLSGRWRARHGAGSGGRCDEPRHPARGPHRLLRGVA